MAFDSPLPEPLVYVVILNWNGWKDTIECLESVFRLNYSNYTVVVCDNNSEDGSIQYLRAWADGYLDVVVSETKAPRRITFPPVSKPISYIELEKDQAEVGREYDTDSPQLILIQTGANLGFAGGCNTGMRFAIAHNGFEYVWLLNNDTVVCSDALMQMVRQMQLETNAGMCGSTVLFYNEPDTIQARGGGGIYQVASQGKPYWRL